MTTTSRKPASRRPNHEPFANVLLIEGESHDHFYALLDRIATELQPADGIEWQLIQNMAAARWCQIRVMSLRIATESKILTDKAAFLDSLARQERSRSSQYNTALRLFKEFRRKP